MMWHSLLCCPRRLFISVCVVYWPLNVTTHGVTGPGRVGTTVPCPERTPIRVASSLTREPTPTSETSAAPVTSMTGRITTATVLPPTGRRGKHPLRRARFRLDSAERILGGRSAIVFSNRKCVVSLIFQLIVICYVDQLGCSN